MTPPRSFDGLCRLIRLWAWTGPVPTVSATIGRATVTASNDRDALDLWRLLDANAFSPTRAPRGVVVELPDDRRVFQRGAK